jgi:hypothetical protein
MRFTQIVDGVANVTSSVANDETGFKDLTLKNLSECSTVITDSQ